MRWRTWGVLAVMAIFALGCVIGLIWFARPTTSAVEKRTLTTYPEFTLQSFLDGSYTNDVSLWYADTYPLREPMVAANEALEGLYGVKTGEGVSGGTHQADEIPVESGSSGAAAARENVEPPTERAVSENIQEQIMDGVYVKDGAGYSIFYFSQEAVDNYAAALNLAAEKLKGEATVYSIIAPCSSIMLSPEEEASIGGSDQYQSYDYLCSKLSPDVVAADCYAEMADRKDEYLYFRTDHHWTQLGAYYAYVAFCKAKGIDPVPLEGKEHKTFAPFNGTYTDTIEAMGSVNTDSVEAYIPNGTNKMTYWDAYDNEVEWDIIADATDYGEESKYMCFIAGDQPLNRIDNPAKDDGSTCLIIKESYGCAFAPCIVDSYQTTYIVDFRYYSKNLADFVREHGVQDVIFMNQFKLAGTLTVSDKLISLFQDDAGESSSDSAESGDQN